MKPANAGTVMSGRLPRSGVIRLNTDGSTICSVSGDSLMNSLLMTVSVTSLASMPVSVGLIFAGWPLVCSKSRWMPTSSVRSSVNARV